MFNVIKTIWWTYVALGAEQELHNYGGGVSYREPNWIYKIHKVFDKDLRCQMNECVTSKAHSPMRMPKMLTRWGRRHKSQ